jgi:hypothetical protein
MMSDGVAKAPGSGREISPVCVVLVKDRYKSHVTYSTQSTESEAKCLISLRDIDYLEPLDN